MQLIIINTDLFNEIKIFQPITFDTIISTTTALFDISTMCNKFICKSYIFSCNQAA